MDPTENPHGDLETLEKGPNARDEPDLRRNRMKKSMGMGEHEKRLLAHIQQPDPDTCYTQ
jgi:hypothetical protein